MSQWGNDHPEEMAEIASLPPSQQNAALRAAMSASYDPDAILDQYEEQQRVRCHRDLRDDSPPSAVRELTSGDDARSARTHGARGYAAENRDDCGEIGAGNTAPRKNASPGGDEPHPTSSRSGSASPGVDLSSRRRYAGTCDNCGAEEDRPCQPWCLGEQFS